jgi:hypothetical protein
MFSVRSLYHGVTRLCEISSTYVVKARSHSVRFILQEVTGDGFVADVARLGGVGADRSRFGRRREEGRGRDEC